MTGREYADSVYYTVVYDDMVPELVVRDAEAGWVWRTIPVPAPKPKRRRKTSKTGAVIVALAVVIGVGLGMVGSYVALVGVPRAHQTVPHVHVQVRESRDNRQRAV